MKSLLFLAAAITTVAVAQTPEAKPSAKIALPAVPGGNPVPKPAKKAAGPTVITSREATFKNSTQTAEFKGEVNVKGPDFEISCDRLKVILKPKAPAGAKSADAPKPAEVEKPVDGKNPPAAAAIGGMGAIEEAIAEGNVIITQDKPGKPGEPPSRYLAKGKKAVFTDAKGSMVLTGWPQILESVEGKPVKQTNALEETTKITLFQSNDMNVDGRSEVILHGKQDK